MGLQHSLEKLGMEQPWSFILAVILEIPRVRPVKKMPMPYDSGPSEGMTIISPAIETLFHDVDHETAARLAATLLPHAALAFESPAPPQAWAETAYDGKRAFLRCMEDHALPTAVQDMFIQRSGVMWDVKDVDSGHEAHVGHLKEVCEAVIGFAGSFQVK
ncbi:MAG: hypothetical protein Q9192_001068 [Flavoplaca navasiana]